MANKAKQKLESAKCSSSEDEIINESSQTLEQRALYYVRSLNQHNYPGGRAQSTGSCAGSFSRYRLKSGMKVTVLTVPTTIYYYYIYIYHYYYLQHRLPQYIADKLLPAGKDIQSGQWLAVCDKTLLLICNFNSAESVHNALQELGIS